VEDPKLGCCLRAPFSFSSGSVLFYSSHRLFTVFIFHVIDKNGGEMTQIKGKIFNEIIFRGSGWKTAVNFNSSDLLILSMALTH